jgi:hypothetical protein
VIIGVEAEVERERGCDGSCGVVFWLWSAGDDGCSRASTPMRVTQLCSYSATVAVQITINRSSQKYSAIDNGFRTVAVYQLMLVEAALGGRWLVPVNVYMRQLRKRVKAS